ncbi:MAG: hypothetical protein U9Q62_05625 [Campylobacterota bacterium]|nr:hypothetical protein [Campylobacterota bacterium]
MKSIKVMSMEELGAYVCSRLEEQGIKTVLSGGSCAEIYSHGKYTSDDIDLVNRYNAKEAEITQVMLGLGFKEYNRYFIHDDTSYFIEFPRGPLGVGDAPVQEIASREHATGVLRLLTPTDCIKDRLAAYYHWRDEQGLEQAVWVAQVNKFDMEAVEQWSKAENELEKFEIFKKRVRE